MFLFAAVSVRADDFNPPSWRGDPGSDYQRWEFDTTSPFPEDYDNPYGTPQCVDFGGGTWMNSYQGRQGVWCIDQGAVMQFLIPDAGDGDVYKLVHVQMTFYGTNYTIFGTPIASGTQDLGGGWTGVWYDFTWPCLALEVILIGEPSCFDELVVDAICVPEPSVVASLVLLGFGILVRRKR